MLKMKDVFGRLEQYKEEIELLNGDYYQNNFTETSLDELREILNALSEKMPSDVSISRALELIDYGTPIDKMASMKEVEINELEENGVLDPESYDAGTLIAEESQERHEILYEEARADLEELKKLIDQICIC